MSKQKGKRDRKWVRGKGEEGKERERDGGKGRKVYKRREGKEVW